MRKSITLLLIFCAAMLSASLQAQTRYLDEIFSDVTVTSDVIYGENVSVLLAPNLDTIPLLMDIYEPTGDTVSSRPVVLIAHSGNFLPKVVNGAYNGDRNDSVIVEFCTRMAKRGFVTIAFTYRQGWDALNSSQEIQTATLLNAAYRGIQDGRAAVRFLRKTVAEDNNPYNINPDQIAMGGVGTGGYVSLGVGYLNDFSEVLLPKFIDFNTGDPYVDTTLLGDVYGVKPADLNIANWPTYSSDVSVVFNLGGALGDSSWINAGEVPNVSFHTPQDPNAPYDIGVVIVPTTGNTVIDQAAGSFAVSRINNRLGNNDVFVNANFNDAYTQAANTLNAGYEGLFPFNRPFTPGPYNCEAGSPVPQLPLTPEGAPWDWWNEAWFKAAWDQVNPSSPTPGIVVNCSQLAGNPDMSPTKGRTYLDSVYNYLSPRLVEVFNSPSTSIENDLFRHSLRVFPNPAKDAVYVTSSDPAYPIKEVRLFNINGQVVRHAEVNSVSNMRIDRNDLQPGLYLLQLRAGKGQAMTTYRVMFQ